MIDNAKAKKILGAVNDNLRNAIALYAVYQRGAADGDLIAKFSDSYAANAFNVLRSGLLHMIVAALSRIWDTDGDALSIPSVKKHLSNPDTQAVIVDRRRQAMLGLEKRPEMLAKYGGEAEILIALRKISEKDADNAVTKARAEIETCLAMINQAMSSPVVATLKNFRNKVIAHTLEITHGESKARAKGEAIANLKYGDERKLLGTTIPIVVALNLLVDDLTVHFDHVEKNWKRYSDEFWNRVH